MADEPLEKLGKFILHQKVGRGGMSDVYRATDTETGFTVALKLFRTSDQRDLDVIKERCQHEMNASQAVDHPNIVKVFESGQMDEHHYFTMEFVQGESLGRRLRTGEPLSLEEKLEVLMQATLGLGAAHRQNIVHRDIKPGNIMLTYDAGGSLLVKVADFGIAADISQSDLAGRDQVPGTPKYLAPEIIRRAGIDGRTDIFALGVTAYEVFTGTDPFVPDDDKGYLRANLVQHPKAVCEVVEGLPEALDLVVAKMLAKDPDDRYTAASLARDISRAQQAVASGEYPVEYDDRESAFFVGEEEDAHERDPVTRTMLMGALGLGGLVVVALALALGFLIVRGEMRRPKSGLAVSKLERQFTEAEVARRWTAPPDMTALAMRTAELVVADGNLEEGKAIYVKLLREAQDPALRAKLRGRARSIDDTFAQRLHDAAAAALQTDDRDRCRELADRLKTTYPRWAAKADALLGRLRARDTDERQREAEIATKAPVELEALEGEAKYILAVKRDYKAVLDKYRAFAAKYADTPQAAAAMQKASGVVGRWQAHLTGSRDVTQSGVDAYFEARQSYRGTDLEGAMKREEAAILLALGKACDGRGDAAGKARALNRLIREYPGSGHAATARQLLAKSVPTTKVEPDRPTFMLGPELVEYFADGLTNPRAWTKLGPTPGMEVSLGGGEMAVVGTHKGASPGVAGLQTIAFGDRGCAAEVQFRLARTQPANAASEVRVVLELSNESGGAFRIYFDGSSYFRGVTKRVAGRTSAIAHAAVDAIGDEKGQFHQLRLTFERGTARVTGFVDEVKIGSHRLKGTSYRLGFFAAAINQVSFDVRFRGLQCRFTP